ncbi:MAG TPA: alpha/beta fold hydrolase [Leptolyngbya sp.]|jgi:4,5:9,10-diseco-3-hydroxy-5,9,17-trioxoandrosta-1(10),2-diene-4-oate hydrolase|nr:alpha/beta fold hydrolase [Leptolyngbya sp.]
MVATQTPINQLDHYAEDHYAQDRYVQVGSVQTRYWEAGQGKKTLILLHGAGGSAEFWYYNLPALARNHRVIAIDLVGSGKSDKPTASYSLTYQAEFVQAFMTALSIEAAILVGHSMSGGVALQLALMAPERVEKLVLVGSFGLGRQISLSARFTTLPLAVRSLQPTAKLMRSMLRHNVFDVNAIPEEWIRLRYSIFALPGRKDSLIQMARTNLCLQGVRESVYRSILAKLPTVTAPTLIVWGKQDRIIPVNHAYIAANYLPHAAPPLLLDRCGHYPHLEHSEQFNQAVLNFVQGCPTDHSSQINLGEGQIRDLG